jgi:hypothetical protein|tara:strand:+ start:2069 stop:2266 length:198 start_codon:yes stop_codon:yes gene_type:complete
MANTVFGVLIERIEEQKSSAIEFLTRGGPKDFAEYKDVCGLVRGLQTARSLVEDLSRNYMEDDDD